MFKPLALFLPLLTAACMSTEGFSTRAAPPDYGTRMAQNQCQDLAKRHIGPTLLKPVSARYRFGRCMPDTLSARPLLGLPKQSGYAMAFEVDAQNKWGNYTGFRSYEILIYDGVVVRRLRESLENGRWETF